MTPPSAFMPARHAVPPLRLLLALFAAYAVWTIPSLLARWGAVPAGLWWLALWGGLAAVAMPIARGRWRGRPLGIALIALAVLLRAPALLLMDRHVPAGDALFYVGLARDLLAGRGLVFVDPLSGVVFRALYPPVYPLLLAGVGAVFGLGQVVLAVTNLACDGAAAWLIVRIGGRLGSRRGGLAAAWLYLIWPTFLFATPFAQKEPLVTLLVLAITHRLLRLADGPARPRDGMLLGLLGGLLALTQPGLATLPALLGLALLPALGLRPLLRVAAFALPALLLVMAPWWIRNALVLHQFVPLTSTAGLGLWIGNNPHATGNWMAMPPDILPLSELAQSARAAAVASAWIAAHPVAALLLNAAKLVRAFGIEHYTLVRLDMVTPDLPPMLPGQFLPMLQGALIAVLTAAAALFGRLRHAPHGDRLVLLTAALFAQIMLFDIWFEFGERHRYCVMPFLFLVIGLSLACHGQDGRRR